MSTSTNHVLIMGPSFSGKTTLAEHFKQHGKVACDTDKDLRIIIDAEGNQTQHTPTTKELEEGRFRFAWPRDRLEDLLKKNAEFYLFGYDIYSAFKPEFLSLFDRIYYLDVTEEEAKRRIQEELKAPKRYVDWGREKSHEKVILSQVKSMRIQAKKAGFTFIDASLPTEKIFDIICNKVPGPKTVKQKI